MASKRFQYVVSGVDDTNSTIPDLPNYAFGNDAHDALTSLSTFGFEISTTFGNGHQKGMAYVHLPASATPFGVAGATIIVTFDQSQVQ